MKKVSEIGDGPESKWNTCIMGLLPELLKKEVFGNCMVHSPLIWKQRTVCSKWLIFIMPKFHTFLFALEKTFKLDKKKTVHVWYICMSVFHTGKKIGLR